MGRDLWTDKRDQGYTALHRQEFDAAEQHFRSALADVCQYGALNPRVAAGHLDLAELFRARGLVAEAERELKRAIALVERRLGPSSDEAIRMNARLAEFFARIQRWDKAKPLLVRMMSLQCGLQSPSIVEAADALRRYADTLAATGQTAEASLFCGFALELHTMELGEHHPHVTRDYVRLRELLGLDQEEEAVPVPPLLQNALLARSAVA